MRRLTLQEFIARSVEHYGDLYDYSRSVYLGDSKKIEIGCHKCGRWFWQYATHHIRGKAGCSYCWKSAGYDGNEFKRRSMAIHQDKYGYDNVVYVNDATKVEIYCKTCDRCFWQKPNKHLQGRGCYTCGRKSYAATRRKSKEQFVAEARAIHGTTYGYDKVNYLRPHTKVIVTCLKHGDFEITPTNHLDSGNGCPRCKQSHGERKVALILDRCNIVYQCQMHFEGCRDKHTLSFDFWLPELNTCIEYQGQQHFVKTSWFGAEVKMEEQQRRDQIKRDWCKANGIRLIEVAYNVGDVEGYLFSALADAVKTDRPVQMVLF